MKIIKNENIPSIDIKTLRRSIISESKEIKNFLGIDSSNINAALPIKKRDFDIWIYYQHESIIGFLSFNKSTYESEVKFIKEFYVLPNFRNKGYGRTMLKFLLEDFPKIECRINPGNVYMYRLVKSIGMKGEKSIMTPLKPKGTQPMWWSNYKEDSFYI